LASGYTFTTGDEELTILYPPPWIERDLPSPPPSRAPAVAEGGGVAAEQRLRGAARIDRRRFGEALRRVSITTGQGFVYRGMDRMVRNTGSC
jgi:hypothetical protein